MTSKLHIYGIMFYFTVPSRSQVETFRTIAGKNQYYFQQLVIENCVYEPKISFEDYVSPTPEKYVHLGEPPFTLGSIRYFSKYILNSTGLYGNPGSAALIDMATKYIQSDEGRLDTLACITLPGLNPESLFDMAPDKLFKIWAMAQTTAPAIGFDSRMILEPAAWEEEQRKVILETKRRNMMQNATAKNGVTRNSNPRVQQEIESSNTFTVK